MTQWAQIIELFLTADKPKRQKLIEDIQDKIIELAGSIEKAECLDDSKCILTAFLNTVEHEYRWTLCTAFALVCYIETKESGQPINELDSPAQALLSHCMMTLTVDERNKVMAHNDVEWPDPNKDLSYDDSSN